MGEKMKSYGLWVVVGVLAVLFLFPLGSSAQVKKSHEFGDVVLDEMVRNKGQMPVVFRHWVHRSKHSCRLCHVDIEFEMSGETEIMEEDNKDGRYCGTCHNGKETFDISECSKCHPKDAKDAQQKEREAKSKFFKFKKSLPPSVYGNKIDWNKAEASGAIIVKDYIEGVSFASESIMSNLRDEPLAPTLPGLPGIIFSHKKHVKWNGCGMCHPTPFALDTGKTKMSMKEITEGKFCGICHGSVAFPLNDCSKCHSAPVQ